MKNSTYLNSEISITPRLQPLLLALCAVFLSGCVGYDRLAFVTNTNVGINVATVPQATAEIDIARGEYLISPTYEDGQSLPVAASFHREGGFFQNDIEAVFSGGPASLAIAQHHFPWDYNSVLCLREKPTESSWNKLLKKLSGHGEQQNHARPLHFGTKMSTGLKLQWSGATSVVPDTLRLGYHRDEVALAPITGRAINPTTDQEGCWGVGRELLRDELINRIEDEAEIMNAAVMAGLSPPEQEAIKPTQPFTWELSSPSFLAIIDTSSKSKTPLQSNQKHSQLFATGNAATYFANRNNDQLFKMMTKSIEGAAAKKPTAEELEKRANQKLRSAKAKLQQLKTVAAVRHLEAAEAMYQRNSNNQARKSVEEARKALYQIGIDAAQKEVDAAENGGNDKQLTD